MDERDDRADAIEEEVPEEEVIDLSELEEALKNAGIPPWDK